MPSEIGKVLAETGNIDEQEQVILDVITLDNETEEENVENGDDNSDDDVSNGGNDQENAEKPSLDNKNDVPTEQQNGNDGEIEMVPVDMDGTSDKENVQPSIEGATAELAATAAASIAPVPNANSTSVVFLKPASVNVSALVQQNTNTGENGATVVKVERKQCFWCEESFVKETSLRNHLKSDHGVVFLTEEERLKEKEEQHHDSMNGTEPGKYVRPAHSMKRKRSSITMAEHNDDIENRDTASQQAGKRKYAKLISEPLRRSNPRV